MLGANVHAGVREAALAVGGYADLLRRTGVASEGDDVYEGRFIVFFGQGGLLDAVAGEVLLGGGAQGKAAGKAQPFGDDCALQEHVGAVLRHFAGYYLVRKRVYLLIVTAFVGEPGNLGENVTADVVNNAVNTSHFRASLSE